MAFTLLRRLALISLLALAGCGSVEMRLDDAPGSDLSVVLTGDAQVYVPKPKLSKSAASTLDDESHPRNLFVINVQRAMVDALARRGIRATTEDSDAGSTLYLRISNFGRGSGTAGFFLRGGIHYSSVDGSAVLDTSRGRRELEIEGASAQSDDSDADDPTSENIRAFAEAIADRITG